MLPKCCSHDNCFRKLTKSENFILFFMEGGGGGGGVRKDDVIQGGEGLPKMTEGGEGV